MNNSESATETKTSKIFGKVMRTFHAVDKAFGKTVDVLGKAAVVTGKSLCLFLLGGAVILGAAVAMAPHEAQRAAEGGLIVIDKKVLQEKDQRILKLENEGTLHRAARKIQGKPLE